MERYYENHFGQLMDRNTNDEVGEYRKGEILNILNAHDDLVAALKELRTMYYDVIDGDDLSDLQKDTIEFVERALAKAEGRDASPSN